MQDTSKSYMPQLDSIRTIAVFLVLIEHWIYQIDWLKNLPMGMTGVTLFFVLSGFLITRILISSRMISEEKNESRFHSIKQFYMRRTLRIFPIYYITLFILLIFNIENIRSIYLWFMLYASNIYFYEISNWAGSLSHLWTLAVEEQFYLVWPFLIFFVPKKHLLKSIIGIIILGPVFRTTLFILNNQDIQMESFIHILTPACMDCFGLGALLAYYHVFSDKDILIKPKIIRTVLLIIFAVIFGLYYFDNSLSGVFLFRFCISVICMLIIYKASVGVKGFMGKILDNTVMMFLGKISYGLYLFHNFMPGLYRSTGLPAINNIYLNAFVQLLMLISISVISWYIIEKPFNNLKKYFKYN